MKIKKVGILTEEQVRDNVMDTLQDTGLCCFYSDLARITGGSYDEATGIGEYWLDGKPSLNKPSERSRKFVGISGSVNFASISDERKGVRIAVSLQDIEGLDTSNPEDVNFEYPLTAMSGGIGQTITRMFDTKSKLLHKTGRQHNVDGNLYEEYEVLGIKFIKMPCKVSKKLLTDGTYSEKLKSIYLRVEKIPFTIDEKAGIMYSDVVLFSQKLGQHKEDTFEDTNISKFLNNGFLASINDELEHRQSGQVFEEKEEVTHNRYHFDFSKLTEEDIIEICIKSNIAVFLHGKTGAGKTERMVALDRNLELVDFGCTNSDGFTGIVAKDFSSKELCLYEPYWYKSLCEKCQKEPELIHILFLEELTNAKSDVQKVAFEVTLNKTLTNSGFRLKLPKNAAVCAAGNEASESRSSIGLIEPLFGRFAHVYIDTDSDKWLKWALKRKQEGRDLKYKEYSETSDIHPAIIDYIKINGDKVLRTPYNGTTPNADPRKWALASKALRICNNPNVLRAFVGDEITKDFIKFSQLPLITIDDVLHDRYTAESIPTDPSIRWYTTVCLTNVEEENLEKVRDFVAHLGSEFLATFDFEWSKGDEEKIMTLYKKEPTLAKRWKQNGHK